ncbi:MAG: hypothetical protein ABIH63_00680 [archaeon]
MKKGLVFVFIFVLSLEVLADCTMPHSFLPPEISSGSTIMMDSFEWIVTESRSGNILHRDIVRKYFEHRDAGAYLTEDQARRIATNFFERNSRVLGTPSSIIVTAAGHTLPAVVTFVGSERQYCNGVPVIGTVSGSLQIGEGEEIQVSSLSINWYVESATSVVPQVPLSQVIAENPGSNPNLALLPDDDGDMRLVWELNDSEGTLIDANTGEEVKPPSPYDRYYNLLFFLLPALAVVVVGYLILSRSGKKPEKKKKINKGIVHK